MDTIQEMKQVSVTEILKEHSLVVPEIQREYVWGRNDYDILDSFLEDIKKGFNNGSRNIDDSSRSLLALLEAANQDQKKVIMDLVTQKSQENNVMNIGFLYSYKPNYYISDEGKDAYLIDGQQRFTTIFLILFYLAIKEGRQNDFLTLYRVNVNSSKIAFDYRVRSLTHNFLIDLIDNTANIDDLLTIADKRWFLSNYKRDTTIKAIVGNKEGEGAFSIIHRQLKDAPIGYFDYTRQNIKFWHFKTEETSQGEELYITMNSRGQQLADNETIRAVLFNTEIGKTEPIRWSTLWEEWQDFFWKNRAEDANSADKGFNEFLCCIGGLQNYLADEKRIYSKDEFERYNQVSSKDILRNISLPVIEKYINALKFLTDNLIRFKSQYSYSLWIDCCITEIWNIFNGNSTNWYANIEDANRATERNKMVFIWSFLHYFEQNNDSEISIDEYFRLIRLFYVRYNNFNRSVSSLRQTIDFISINGVFDVIPQVVNGNLDENGNVIQTPIIEETDSGIKTKEETLKYKFLNKFISNTDIQRKYEELIWEIEDHKFNIKGRDVGSVNIGYLIDLEQEYSIEELKLIKNKLYEVFPINKKEYPEIQNVLFYFGEFWHRISPWYYYNFQFDNWHRIIRDRDHNNKHTRQVFKTFFYEYVKFDGDVNQFIEKKRETLINATDCIELYQKLCWYNQYLSNKMWSQGNYIAFSNDTDFNALPNYLDSDKAFPSIKIIYNTKGNLKGGTPKKLYSLLPSSVKKDI